MGTRAVIGVLSFALGVAVGLYAAKMYARAKLQSDADAVLEKLGLGGGTVQGLVDNTVVPSLVD